MGVALAPAVAGGRHAHEPGVLPVLHVAGEDAVLDQGRVAGRGALVVDGQRAAPVRDRAVVDHGHARGGDPLAQQTGEGRGLLAVEVALQAVADRLVQQHPRPAGAEHDLHLAGRRVDRAEIDQRLAQRLVGGRLPVGGLKQALVGDSAAAAVAAALHAIALADHDGDVEPDQRADVRGPLAAGAQDLDRLPVAADRGGHLAHPRVLAAGVGVDLFQQLDLGLEGHESQGVVVAVEPRVGAERRLGHGAVVAALDRLHGFRRPLDRRL